MKEGSGASVITLIPYRKCSILMEALAGLTMLQSTGHKGSPNSWWIWKWSRSSSTGRQCMRAKPEQIEKRRVRLSGDSMWSLLIAQSKLGDGAPVSFPLNPPPPGFPPHLVTVHNSSKDFYLQTWTDSTSTPTASWQRPPTQSSEWWIRKYLGIFLERGINVHPFGRVPDTRRI